MIETTCNLAPCWRCSGCDRVLGSRDPADLGPDGPSYYELRAGPHDPPTSCYCAEGNRALPGAELLVLS